MRAPLLLLVSNTDIRQMPQAPGPTVRRYPSTTKRSITVA